MAAPRRIVFLARSLAFLVPVFCLSMALQLGCGITEADDVSTQHDGQTGYGYTGYDDDYGGYYGGYW